MSRTTDLDPSGDAERLSMNLLAEADRRARKRRRARMFRGWLLRAVGSIRTPDGSWTPVVTASNPALSVVLVLATVGLFVTIVTVWINR